MTHVPRLVLPAWLLGACLALISSESALGDVCDPLSIGVDTSYADTTVVVFDCRGFGQVFLARDTLIQSISAWRPPQPALDGRPRHLFITETDTTESGTVYPKTPGHVLLDAGPLVNQVGDGIHPVEYRWVFDPPFALP